MRRSLTASRLGLLFALLLLPAALAQTAAADAPRRLELEKGDRIIILGNTLAERMQHFPHFEVLLQSRFPDKELILHNLGWSADELTIRPRSKDFQEHGHTLHDEKPDVILAAFGFNESFKGPKGLDQFKADLAKFITETTSTKYNGESPPTLVLLSPIAHEDLDNPHLPNGQANNANLQSLHRRHGRGREEPRHSLRRSVHTHTKALRLRVRPAHDQWRPPQRPRLPQARPRPR